MSYFRAYDVKIRKEDREKADAILEQHDVDEITCSEEKDSDGSATITYWIRPYLCEDVDIIMNEFVTAGIQIL